jgi:hypothetical protein
MKRLTFHAVSLCFLVALAPTQKAFGADAGTVQEISGSVTIIGSDNRSRQARAREVIQSGDTLQTAPKSEVVVKLADDSRIALRQNTRLQVTDFRFEQKPSDSSIISILRGTARMISGLIGKNTPSQVTVRAPTATIGIRGTDFEVAVIPDDATDARAGVYNYVRDGSTNIQIASGQQADVRKDQTAFAPQNPRPGEDPLQILRETPTFLQQGGGLDALIQSIVVMPPPMIFR